MGTKARGKPGDAGRDRKLSERLARDPENLDAQLDVGLDESMDASDPPAVVAPGYDEPEPGVDKPVR